MSVFKKCKYFGSTPVTFVCLFLFQCRLRDFPQAVFTSQSVELKGTLLGAEQKPASRSKFDTGSR